MKKSRKGVKGAGIKGYIPPQAEVVPVSRLAAYLEGLSKNVKESIDAKTKDFSADDIAWIGTLIQLFRESRDPELLIPRTFDSVLDMAIAYSLPYIISISGANLSMIREKVGRLRALRYEDETPAFSSPFSLSKKATSDLTARLAEVSSGLFDYILNAEVPIVSINRADHIWRNKLTLKEEEGVERAKFLQLGRVGENKARGPVCPKCGSRDTVVMTLQLRRNDEAPTSEFSCKNCGFNSGQ